MAHHLRAEGWLNVKVHDSAAKRLYVVMDGFVLRVFTTEPAGAHVEDTMAAEEILDLRYMESLKPVDPYNPPPKGACTLTGKEESKDKKKAKKKHLTFECGGLDPSQSWWLQHLTSAVPHHAVGSTMRSQRDEATVLALMTEHSQQPTAFKLTDKDWRKTMAELKKRESSQRSHRSHRNSDKKGDGASNSIADKLAKAREAREHHGMDEAPTPDKDDSYIDVSDSAHADSSGAPQLSAAERAEQRKLMGIGSGTATISDTVAAGQTAATMPANPSPNKASTNNGLPTKPEVAAAAAVDAASDSDTEWWFTKATDGHIEGPFTNREMKVKYQRGKVHETTLVRFLPCEDCKPRHEAQVDAQFAPLEECCTASGPPFMDC